ncbi:MAG: glutamate-5-semialdehyde dehydrogenase, partial [Clostridia bacterium]|nr:glutamate-5-semialdehyde dehydrogenase [Clostridia bacterium]
AKLAAGTLACSGTDLRNRALELIAQALTGHADEIIAANEADITAAREVGISESLLDRLRFTRERITSTAEGVKKVALLDDPLGRSDGAWTRPNGLRICRMRVPLGVIGIIYDARPNVTADAAALTLKSGNACILRGGKEAIRTNIAVMGLIRSALQKAGLPADCCQIVEDTSHESAQELMRLSRWLDVLIPRGGAGLIRSVVESASVPVIRTGEGNCHVYVDESADIDMAAQIIFNAKTSRPSVCNAAETLLVHQGIAQAFLPAAKKLLDEKHVELRGCARTQAILGPQVKPATEQDWETEYNDYILAVKVVDGIDEAITHINTYGSGHSEAIVTESYANAEKFLSQVDAAAVYVNASTRFTDGYEFGLGAEIGISTQKLHARGPMGLGELTTTKYAVYGSGQIRL